MEFHYFSCHFQLAARPFRRPDGGGGKASAGTDRMLETLVLGEESRPDKGDMASRGNCAVKFYNTLNPNP